MSMITFRLAREAQERKAQEKVQSVSPVESPAEEAPVAECSIKPPAESKPAEEVPVAECSIKPPTESKPIESKPAQAKAPVTSAAKVKAAPGVTSSK